MLTHEVLSVYSILIGVHCQCVGVAAEVAQSLSHCAFLARAFTRCRKNSLDFYPLVLNIVAVVGGRKPGLSSPLR